MRGEGGAGSSLGRARGCPATPHVRTGGIQRAASNALRNGALPTGQEAVDERKQACVKRVTMGAPRRRAPRAAQSG